MNPCPVPIHAVITRCTGPGGVRWQHVAQQLGRSVDSVRCEFDPTYRQDERPPSIAAVVQPDEGEKPPRRPAPECGAKFLQPALTALLNGPLDGGKLAEATGAIRSSVSRRMTTLIQKGWAVRYRQWGPNTAPLYRLTEDGERRAVARK